MDPSKASDLRTLNACQACSRQYDVSHLRPGDSVRCECGVRFRAEFKQPHAPRHLRCSNCGGNVRAEAQSCEYCQAEITLEEKALNSICPRCWARMTDRAKFCMECGIGIQPQTLLALEASTGCPRCRGELRRRELVGMQVIECSVCGGMWLSQDHFEDVCESADRQERAARELRESPAPNRPDTGRELRYVPCVACKELMNRRNYAAMSGVVIDVCRKHGIWLDHGELEKILAFVRKGGLDRARSRELERLKLERSRVRDSSGPLHAPAGGAWDAPAYFAGDALLEWLISGVTRLWH